MPLDYPSCDFSTCSSTVHRTHLHAFDSSIKRLYTAYVVSCRFGDSAPQKISLLPLGKREFLYMGDQKNRSEISPCPPAILILQGIFIAIKAT